VLVSPEQIRRAQGGDLEAFHQIVQAYRPRIAGTLARLVAPEKAPDVANDVFLRLHAALGELAGPQAFEPWLYRITVNTAYECRRRER
jgi:RNA polymerase sigma-70 factor, ECF subfamily